MIYYYTAYVITTTLVYLGFYSERSLNNKLVRKYFLLCCLIFCALFSSLRDLGVGTDTWLYVLDFQNSDNFNDLYSLLGIYNESGYQIIKYLVRGVTSNYSYLFFILSLYICMLYIIVISKLSTSPVISFIIFLLLGFYTFHFNALRQGLACAIVIYSSIYILKSDFKKYISCILIGFLFHKSIIILIPMYFLAKVKLDFKKIIYITCTFLILFLLMGDIVGYISSNIDSRYSTFGSDEGGRKGIVTSIFNLLLFIYLYMSSKFYSEDIYQIGLNYVFIGALISVLTVIFKLDPNGIGRLSVYFMQFSIILLPLSLNAYAPRLRIFILMLILIIALVYNNLTLNAFGNLMPFQFKEGLFSELY